MNAKIKHRIRALNRDGYLPALLITVLIIGGSLSASAYRHHQAQIKVAQATAQQKQDLAANQAYDVQQESNNSADSSQSIDCSNYQPTNPNAMPTYNGAVSSNQSGNTSCALKCDVEQLGLLGYQSKGLAITQQIYDEVYVKQIEKDNCGTPLPYCVFNTSVSCPATSAPSTNGSGYDAGYSYGEQYQICDPGYDNGKSQDFNAGVNAWTADNCTDGQLNSDAGN